MACSIHYPSSDKILLSSYALTDVIPLVSINLCRKVPPHTTTLRCRKHVPSPFNKRKLSSCGILGQLVLGIGKVQKLLMQ